MADLEGAYALETPEDNKRLYAQWADTYDESFAASHGYVVPDIVAKAHTDAGGKGLVLDVGAGTGLVGVALANQGHGQIDGTDISSEMLAEAALKDVYDRLFEGDLTACLDVEDATYDGIVSAGTFTHGHVGPDAIDELIRIAKLGALITISINAEHFETQGFATKFQSISGRIRDFETKDFGLYAGGGAGSHAKDMGRLVQFFVV